MAVYLAMCRIGNCEVCTGQFYIEGDLPRQCPHCGSLIWLYGIESKNSRLIRLGIERKDKILNKGVKSKGRQEASRAHPSFEKYHEQRREAAKKRKEAGDAKEDGTEVAN